MSFKPQHVIQTVVSYSHRNILNLLMVVSVILVEQQIKLVYISGYPGNIEHRI